MSALDPWADPDLAVGGDYFSFVNVGDSITGKVLAIQKQVWDDGKISPKLILQLADGSEKTVTAGQVRLKAMLADARPQVGQTVRITMTEIEKRSGGKTLKHFSVEVGGPAAVAAPTTTTLTADQAAALATLGVQEVAPF